MNKIVVILLSLTVMAVAQHGQRQYTQLLDFDGGINVNSDSGSLKLNEALVMDNLTFERYGALKKRYGYTYWNTRAFPSGDTIKNIHYLFRTHDNDILLMATNNYIYQSPFNDTVTTEANWNDQRLYNGYGMQGSSGDSILYITADANKWMLAWIREGDSLIIDDFGFVVDSIISDSSVELNDTLPTAFDGAGVGRIYRSIIGEPYIESWNSNAYIADDESPPFYFDGDKYYWLNCLDTGTVDIVELSQNDVALSDTVEIDYYCLNSDRISANIYVYGTSTFRDSLETLIDIDTINVLIRHENYCTSTPNDYILRTIISRASEYLFVCDVGEQEPVTDYYHTSAYFYNHVDSSSGHQFADTSKAWKYGEWISYYIVSGKRPDRIHRVVFNDNQNIGIVKGDTISANVLGVGDRYYIYESIPYADSWVSDTLKSPRYNQFMFHKNILYGYGYSFDEDGDTVNMGFVYHSDIGLPKRWITFEGFDLSLNAEDNITSMFKLYDDLYISTPSNIYRLTGWPPAIGNGALIEVISGTGIDSYNSMVRRDNNVAYIARNDGFYYFDGNKITKISRKIDPLIDSYRGSGYNLSYYDENVYFSFVDSNYTFAYYKPTHTFTRLSFGMNVVNNQATLVDSGYFLFAHTGLSDSTRRIYKYPTSNFVDYTNDSTNAGISFNYKTGWMDFNNLQWQKVYERFYIPLVKSTDNLICRFRLDYDTTTVQTFTIADSACVACGKHFDKVFDFNTAMKGRRIQFEIECANSIQEHAIGKWGLRWYPDTDY